MTSSPGEGYGQLVIDRTIRGWNLSATLIAMYYCAWGFSWQTVSLLITVKTENASLRCYRVQERMEEKLCQHKQYYNREDDAFNLFEVGKAIAAYMKDAKIPEDWRIQLWERLSTIPKREWETMMGEGDRMEQRQCYGKEMTPEQVRKKLERGFLEMFNASED